MEKYIRSINRNRSYDQKEIVICYYATSAGNRKMNEKTEKKDIAKYIDHTMLKADATRETVLRYCREAKELGFCSVCVNSVHVALVAKELEGSGVRTCAVAGFPLGAMDTEAKAFEAVRAVEQGADEIDIVMDIGAMKEGRYDDVKKDIETVVTACRKAGGQNKIVVKVIIETCLLTDEEKIKASRIAAEAGADFVKTSTGMSTGGATAEDVRLIKKALNGRAKIKASGGIRSHQSALELLEAGADRLGAGDGKLLLPKD